MKQHPNRHLIGKPTNERGHEWERIYDKFFHEKESYKGGFLRWGEIKKDESHPQGVIKNAG
jgi:hypothetical protein